MKAEPYTTSAFPSISGFQQAHIPRADRYSRSTAVLDEAELAARLFYSSANGRALALVARLPDDADNARLSAADLLGDFCRSIGRAVIDYHDLAVHSLRCTCAASATRSSKGPMNSSSL